MTVLNSDLADGLAGRIVEWRTTRGPFTSVDDLGQVEGIGSSVLEESRSAARV